MAEFAHNLWKHDIMQKTPHELLTGTNPQINIQLIKENVPAAIYRLQQLVEARHTTSTIMSGTNTTGKR
jgi:hypothetical protein